MGGRERGPVHDLRDADDRRLAAALVERDERAMDEVVRRERPAILALARRLSGDATRAEEVAQEVLVRLWERPDRFDPDRGSLRSFLLATTHGRALDAVRSESARHRREQRYGTGPETAPARVESVVVARTVAEAVDAALAALPEGERRAVALAYLGGHSYREVARLLDEPEGTVKSRIRTGLAKLRRELTAQDLHG